MLPPDAKILFESADGPEGLHIYTSEDRAVVDWGTDIPGLYIEAAVNGAYVKLGPFHMKKIRQALEERLMGQRGLGRQTVTINGEQGGLF